MFYYLYEVKNKINGKVYVGVHKTQNLNDGYMGSGKVLKRAIEKHGVENFTKTILEHFDSAEAMYAREKEVVNEDFLNRDDTYNLRCGGLGGFDYLNDGSQEHLDRARKAAPLGFVVCKMNKIGIFSPDFVSPFKDPKIRSLGNTKEAKEKAKASQRKTYSSIQHQSGEKNSQFGSMWITDETINKKIRKLDAIPDGWRRGRVIGL
jgi:hypothetical protein